MKQAPYLALGEMIAAARVAVGLASQGELAVRLRVTQQSVSRWEAGTHRPKADQLAAISQIANADISLLRRLAGYDLLPVQSFVEPFPVDRLDPVTFEVFIADLAQALYPSGQVRRVGGTGHDQDGIDVEAWIERRRVVWQCKRMNRFGPAEVNAVVKAFTGQADRKILALSRVASPQAAAALRAAPDWELWDKDDISRKIRTLPVEAQERLVDIFFRGQRQALLGRPEPGPWRASQDFFRPFDSQDLAFSHGWALLGREEEMARLEQALEAPPPTVVVLSAAGGMGKSRLLKALSDVIAAARPQVVMRFLLGAEDATRANLETLGRGEKILVVDDAHDRDGLGVLLAFAADRTNNTRLLLATRPYSLHRIRREAAVHGLSDPVVVDLAPLSRKDLEALAGQVLEGAGAPVAWADAIVEASGGSPLFVSMAAKVMAKDRVAPELTKNASAIRDLVMGKFARVITGDLGQKGDERLHRDVLEILALVQPFHPQDPQLLGLLAQLKAIDQETAARVLRTFVEGGVIFPRGAQFRLMPDVLGDYLIEDCCLVAGGLSAFARRALDEMPPSLLPNVMVNLGRLDWRLNDGDTRQSTLLDSVWHRLQGIDNDWDRRLNAVKAVAIFQPRQALAFAANMARLGRAQRVLPDILRNIAYTEGHFVEVARLLWMLGRDDKREQGPNPSHAIRVLAELGDYQRQKPLRYNREALAFALNLADDDRQWGGHATPLDLLRPFLSTEGSTTRSEGRTFSVSGFVVDHEVVRPLRQQVINKLLALLDHPRVSIARRAAAMFEAALRGPIGIMGATAPEGGLDSLNAEFAQTLEQLRLRVVAGLRPIVAMELAKVAAWHARHARPNVAQVAQAVMDQLPIDSDFQLLCALGDGYGKVFVDMRDPELWRENYRVWIEGVIVSLEHAYPEAEPRRDRLEALLRDLADAGAKVEAAHTLVALLLGRDLAFAHAMIDDALLRGGSATRRFAGQALQAVLAQDRAVGLTLAERFVRTEAPDLSVAAAEGYLGFGEPLSASDERLLRGLLASHTYAVVAAAARAAWSLRKAEPEQVLSLLLSANITVDGKLVDEIALWLTSSEHGGLDLLDQDQATQLLQRLTPVPQLEGFWIDKLLAELSFRFPFQTAAFFITRVEMAARTNDYQFRPINHGPYAQEQLRFLEAPEGAAVVEQVWDWLQAHRDRDWFFQDAATTLFEAMFLFDDTALAAFLTPRLDTAIATDLELMGRLAAKTQPSFIFNQPDFVIGFLERVQAVDPGLLEEAVGHFVASAVSGVRGGDLGEPTPEDLFQLEGAERVLAGLSMISPAYLVYDRARRDALANIERSRRQGEATDAS